jgi:restriction system protein
MSKTYLRIMLGSKNAHLQECLDGHFVYAGYIRDVDLTHHLPDKWKDFNKEFIPVFLQQNPQKSRVAAGLACGMLWTVAKSLKNGDVVLCPDGNGNYYAGEITGDYEFHKGQTLQHRRPVNWFPSTFSQDAMSEALKMSAGSRGTVCDLSGYASELEVLLSGSVLPKITVIDKTIEDPITFALEKHLEDFLVQNWKFTELGKKYDIFEEEGELVGQQFRTDTGPIDILAISKDKKELLVVELKRGRVSDAVVGQIQRYMGFVKEELAESGQKVQGVIIALQDDLGLRRALSVTQNIDFYTYKVNFKLVRNQPGNISGTKNEE